MRIPEILSNTNFGRDILNTLSKFDIKKVIEIGSGSGNGSTQVFLQYFDSILDVNKKLYCFEPVKSWFEDLKKHTEQKKYCTLYNESAICYSDFLVKNFDIDFYDTPYNKLKDRYDKNTLKTWYDQDLPYFKQSQYSILPTLEADAVLIDGCEFSGYSEYKKLNSTIRLIFLDDCLTAFKNNQVFLELVKNEQWEMVSINNERNGYAIFAKKL